MVIDPVATVGALLTVYVPVPPDPVPKAVMNVLDGMLDPVINCPTYKVPDVTAVTVRVVLLIGMLPVTDAANPVASAPLADNVPVMDSLPPTVRLPGTLKLPSEDVDAEKKPVVPSQ